MGEYETSAERLFCLPEDGGLRRPQLERGDEGFAPRDDPLGGRANWGDPPSLEPATDV